MPSAPARAPVGSPLLSLVARLERSARVGRPACSPCQQCRRVHAFTAYKRPGCPGRRLGHGACPGHMRTYRRAAIFFCAVR
eukprot:15450055-Alexandrium_andersonii.AAC.1